MYSIHRDMIIDYHNKNYHPSNFVIVGAGGHQHEALVESVSKHFANLPQKISELTSSNKEKPTFSNEVVSLQIDSQSEHLNVGIFYEAPAWSDPDYYSFLLLQRIMSDKPESVA